MARREKKPVHKVVMTEGKRNIIRKRSIFQRLILINACIIFVRL